MSVFDESFMNSFVKIKTYNITIVFLEQSNYGWKKERII